jgi:outer membrane protein OmpA-like peptidoglycan-associated protein
MPRLKAATQLALGFIPIMRKGSRFVTVGAGAMRPAMQLTTTDRRAQARRRR